MNKKRTLTLAIGILGILVVLGLSGAFYTVQEGEQVIILRLGKVVGEPITTAGLNYKIPFIDNVRRFEKRLLIWDGDPNQIPTKGREFILVDTTARWRIIDPKKFLESVATEQGAQSRLDDVIDSSVRSQVSGNELVELVRSASWVTPGEEVLEEVPAEREKELKKKISLGREEITRAILLEARKVVPQYGIELIDVRIKRLNYIQSVREKVYTRMISERKRIAARFRSEGEGDSAEILGTMEKDLRRIRSTAYRRAQVIRGKADAQATKIYGMAFNKDPEFYAFSRTLEAYKEGQNKNSVLILTTDSDYYRYLKEATSGDKRRRR
ncbi:MAG: protease modulator HflC [candidate division NC10 bacterium]|nr:protease modulator HflC [candidate division NC10 bacterium]